MLIASMIASIAVDLRQLKRWLRLVSDHALRDILASEMTFVSLLYWLPVVVKDAVTVQLLFR